MATINPLLYFVNLETQLVFCW